MREKGGQGEGEGESWTGHTRWLPRGAMHLHGTALDRGTLGPRQEGDGAGLLPAVCGVLSYRVSHDQAFSIGLGCEKHDSMSVAGREGGGPLGQCQHDKITRKAIDVHTVSKKLIKLPFSTDRSARFSIYASCKKLCFIYHVRGKTL